MNFNLRLSSSEIYILKQDNYLFPDPSPPLSQFEREKWLLEILCSIPDEHSLKNEVLRQIKYNWGYKRKATYMKIIALIGSWYNHLLILI